MISIDESSKNFVLRLKTQHSVSFIYGVWKVSIKKGYKLYTECTENEKQSYRRSNIRRPRFTPHFTLTNEKGGRISLVIKEFLKTPRIPISYQYTSMR